MVRVKARNLRFKRGLSRGRRWFKPYITRLFIAQKAPGIAPQGLRLQLGYDTAASTQQAVMIPTV